MIRIRKTLSCNWPTLLLSKSCQHFAEQYLKWYRHSYLRLHHQFDKKIRRALLFWSSWLGAGWRGSPWPLCKQLVGCHQAERRLVSGIWEKWVALPANPASPGTGCAPTRGLCQHGYSHLAMKPIKGHPAAFGHSYLIKHSFSKHLKTNHAWLWLRWISNSELSTRIQTIILKQYFCSKNVKLLDSNQSNNISYWAPFCRLGSVDL